MTAISSLRLFALALHLLLLQLLLAQRLVLAVKQPSLLKLLINIDDVSHHHSKEHDQGPGEVVLGIRVRLAAISPTDNVSLLLNGIRLELVEVGDGRGGLGEFHLAVLGHGIHALSEKKYRLDNEGQKEL